MISVLIADDHAMVRSGLRMILGAASDIEVVGEAADGSEATEAARRLRPDVILMDLNMPRVDGLGATARISAMNLPCRILMLTTFAADENVHRALRAGASGFLLKDADPPELLRAVRVTAAGEALFSPSILATLSARFAGSPLADDHPAPLASLTARELEVFTLLARGLANDDAAARLHISAATVKTHITRIFAKLGLRDRAQAVVLGYESGLIRPGDAP